jgi:hypothetical protein
MKFTDAVLDHEDTRHKRSGCGQNLTKHQPKANTEMTEEEKGQLGGGKKEGDPLWTDPELNRTPFAKSPKCKANVINQLHHVPRSILAIPMVASAVYDVTDLKLCSVFRCAGSKEIASDKLAAAISGTTCLFAFLWTYRIRGACPADRQREESNI